MAKASSDHRTLGSSWEQDGRSPNAHKEGAQLGGGMAMNLSTSDCVTCPEDLLFGTGVARTLLYGRVLYLEPLTLTTFHHSIDNDHLRWDLWPSLPRSLHFSNLSQLWHFAKKHLLLMDISVRPFYAMGDHYVQGDTTPQHGVPTSYNRLSSRGIRLRPVSDLRMFSSSRQILVLMSLSADAYRSLFTFGVFNAIQSACFDYVSLSVAP